MCGHAGYVRTRRRQLIPEIDIWPPLLSCSARSSSSSSARCSLRLSQPPSHHPLSLSLFPVLSGFSRKNLGPSGAEQGRQSVSPSRLSFRRFLSLTHRTHANRSRTRFRLRDTDSCLFILTVSRSRGSLVPPALDPPHPFVVVKRVSSRLSECLTNPVCVSSLVLRIELLLRDFTARYQNILTKTKQFL